MKDHLIQTALLLLALLVYLYFGSVPGLAMEYGTVISVRGEVTFESSVDHSTQKLRAARKLFAGDKIITGKKGAALILTSDGTFFSIKEKKTITYHLYSGYSKTGHADSFDALNQFYRFHPAFAPARMRGESDFQSKWMELLQKATISGADLDLVFQMLGSYQELSQGNRVKTLLLKLSDSFPENPGFIALANQAFSGVRNPVEWNILQVISDKQLALKANDTLSEKDLIQIHYQVSEESYYYIFLTTQRKASTRISSKLLFPDQIDSVVQTDDGAFFQARREPGIKHHLPSVGQAYPLNEVQGTEHFWGWSCSGPVLNQSQVTAIIYKVESRIQREPETWTQEVQKTAPAVCQSVFFKRIHHEKRPAVARR